MGLRLKLTLTLLALGLVPLATTTGVLSYLNLERLKLSTKEYRLATADVVVNSVKEMLRASHAELAVLGAAVSDSQVSVDHRLQVARAHLLGGAHVKAVSIYDRAEVHVDTLRAGRAPAPLKAPASLSEALRGVARTEGQLHLEVQRSAARGELLLPLLRPVYQGPQRSLYGYLWTAVSLEPLHAVVRSASQRRFGKQPDRVYIIDGSFRIIAHGLAAERFKSIRGHGIAGDIHGNRLPRGVALAAEFDHHGAPMLGALVPLEQPRWGVVVQQPRDEAYAGVRTTWITALAVGAAFALLAVALGLFLGQRFTAPVLDVARAASRVAGGDFDVQVPVRSSDEVGQMATAFNTMTSDLRDFRQRVVEETRIRADLSRYLSAELVDQVVSEKIELELGGRRRRVTVLFADVVAFTPLAEEHEPEFVVGILNELFTFLTEIVFKHGGVVDKFMGDCVMAVFGVPQPGDRDAANAVAAAEEMLRWLDVGNARWQKQLGRRLELGIGINSGEVILGNVGSDKRMEYTVIGDAVNVASRLENLARPGQVLLTRTTRELAGDEEFDFESLGTHNVTGRGEPVEVFELEV